MYFQSLHPTIEDIYEVLIENEQSVKEKVRIFDTAGLVRTNYVKMRTLVYCWSMEVLGTSLSACDTPLSLIPFFMIS